jgi:DNA-binding response OmpR family regulator
MGVAGKVKLPTDRSVRTVVRASRAVALPAELTAWAAANSVRILVRPELTEAIAAARDTGATMLIIDCNLVQDDARRLSELLEQGRVRTPTLCIGPPECRTSFLTGGASDYVDVSAGWDEVLAYASKLIDTTSMANKASSGVRRTARSVIQVGPIVIELASRRVFVHEQPLVLRPAEFEVLVLLALNKNRPVSATEIVQHALATHGDGSSARNQLFELRRKLRDVGLQDAIRTIRNQGYQLELD